MDSDGLQRYSPLSTKNLELILNLQWTTIGSKGKIIIIIIFNLQLQLTQMVYNGKQYHDQIIIIFIYNLKL